MNFIKRAFWNMKAKKGKTLLQLFVFTVICVFVLSGLTIQSAAQKSSELARQELGGSVTLQVDRQKQMEKQQDSGEKRSFESTPIKVSDANKLAALDHVKSYNYITSASANAETLMPLKAQALVQVIPAQAQILKTDKADRKGFRPIFLLKVSPAQR